MSACRSRIEDGARRLAVNRRWRSQRNGSADPVRANASRKKNSQRGPTVGSVLESSSIKPNQPKLARIAALIIKLR